LSLFLSVKLSCLIILVFFPTLDCTMAIYFIDVILNADFKNIIRIICAIYLENNYIHVAFLLIPEILYSFNIYNIYRLSLGFCLL
jgi:hypothetical protein